MKNRLPLLILLLIYLLLDLFPAPQTKGMNLTKRERDAYYKTLSGQYRFFYDLVSYIATDQEKNVFLSLDTDRDRQAFMNIFWSQRDPTKGTPDNEFRDEHIRRFNHTNYYFGRGTHLAGWKTDRGRIYITLGPPISKESFDSSGIYPIEIWDYLGGGDTGLPPTFRVTFYQKGSTGDKRFYVPGQDNPEVLLQKGVGDLDAADYVEAFKRLHDINPTVAEAALTMVPGDRSYGARPSPLGPMIMSSILEFPTRKLNIRYATDFLKYKGLVTVEESTGYLSSKHDRIIYYHPILKMHLLHFAILPERVSVDYSPERDRYYLNYRLTVSIKKGKDTVYHYTKSFPFYYTKQELDTSLAAGLVIADYLPVIPGEWEITALLHNAVNNEFAFYEDRIVIPAVKTGVKPSIQGALVTHEVDHSPQISYSPYHFVDTRVHINCDPVFGVKDQPTLFFVVDSPAQVGPMKADIVLESLSREGGAAQSHSLELPAGESQYRKSYKFKDVPAGYYRVRLSVFGRDGMVQDSKTLTFSVSPQNTIPRAMAAYGSMSPQNVFVLQGILGSQYAAVGAWDEASTNFEAALKLGGSHPALIKTYSEFLLDRQNGSRILDIVGPLQKESDTLFDFHALRGKALLQMKRYGEAVDDLSRANGIYNSDNTVLNSLGLAFLGLDKKEEARKAFAASLGIDREQPEIFRLIQGLDAEKK